ncbi:hypothetical protein QA640_04675 [Bradyrhizobium sp. CB82]|uniref:hypothetical protein n=1 Tax=Bradyrhizobium sp. CB82 TaxID=3039159 RepID=UPI0024B1FB9A|nr:hypothetical protein [Bradyrhizobium sp. CB82]WFU41807.1 hypothetical protein QA640_04675 [Bradyrhizobium sp. CB82]
MQFVDQLGLGKPMPVASATTTFSLDKTMRILLINTTPSAIEVSPTSTIGALELSGAADVGFSGSPMFDAAGNLIGIVTEGVSGQNRFIARTTGSFREWLVKNEVGNIAPEPSPDVLALYVTTSNNAASVNLIYKFFVGPLTEQLTVRCARCARNRASEDR